MAFRALRERRSDLLLQPALERAALRVEVEHYVVVNYSVDRCEGGHGIVEKFLSFGENQIGRDHDAVALIALGEECEEDFHLLSVPLDVADVIENDTREAVEICKFLW